MAEQTIELNVEGMSCGHCERSVAAAIRALPGIVSCEVSQAKGKAMVTYDPGKIKTEQIQQAVNDTGIYRATIH